MKGSLTGLYEYSDRNRKYHAISERDLSEIDINLVWKPTWMNNDFAQLMLLDYQEMIMSGGDLFNSSD